MTFFSLFFLSLQSMFASVNICPDAVKVSPGTAAKSERREGVLVRGWGRSERGWERLTKVVRGCAWLERL